MQHFRIQTKYIDEGCKRTCSNVFVLESSAVSFFGCSNFWKCSQRNQTNDALDYYWNNVKDIQITRLIELWIWWNHKNFMYREDENCCFQHCFFKCQSSFQTILVRTINLCWCLCLKCSFSWARHFVKFFEPNTTNKKRSCSCADFSSDNWNFFETQIFVVFQSKW